MNRLFLALLVCLMVSCGPQPDRLVLRTHESIVFPTSNLRVEKILTIGVEIGAEEETFGFISGATIRDGRIYVLDSHVKRFAVYDASGSFLHWTGQQGAGPGEFQRPKWIGFIDGVLAVFDEGNARLSLFDDSVFVSSIQTTAPTVISWVNGGRTLLLTGELDGKLLHRWSPGSEHLWPVPSEIPFWSTGQSLISQGASCELANGHLLWANPWVHELIELDGETVVRGLRRADGGTQRIRLTENEDAIPSAFQLGLVCSESFVIYVYSDVPTYTTTLEVYDADVNPLATFTGPTPELPVFLGALDGNLLIGHRTRPFSHVNLYRITP